MKKIILLWLAIASIAFSQINTAIVYVRSGDPDVDSHSYTNLILTAQRADQNAGSVADYVVYAVDYFEDVEAFNNLADKVVLVTHGVYNQSNTVFTGHVIDKTVDSNGKPVTTRAADVESLNVDKVVYCGMYGHNLKVDNNDVLVILSQLNGHGVVLFGSNDNKWVDAITFVTVNDLQNYWNLDYGGDRWQYYHSGTWYWVSVNIVTLVMDPIFEVPYDDWDT
jgi:hypothetical protein